MEGKKKYRFRFVFAPHAIILYALLLSFSAIGQGVALQKKIKDIQKLLTTVAAKKPTYVQDLKTISPGYYEYSVIEMNDKGNEKEAIYSFSFADISSRLVRSFTKKDIILIELSVTGKQKLIKKSTDGGTKTTYLSGFTMYGLNADNGRTIEKTIKEVIPDAIELDKGYLSLHSYNDHLNWLKANISNVDSSKKQIEQYVTLDVTKPGFIALEQTQGSKQKRMELNLSLLDPNSVKYKISGSEFGIEIKTKKGIKGIKYLEGTSIKGFQNNLIFYASSAVNGKNIYKVLKNSIPLAETQFNESKPDLESVSKALKYLNGHIAHITTADGTLEQHLELKNDMGHIIIQEVKGDKSDAYEYNFDLADINRSTLTCNSKKDKLFIELNTTNKGQNFINFIKNGELQNYIKKFMLFFNTMEEAFIGKEAIRFLIEQRKNSITDESDTVIPLHEALVELQKKIEIVESDGERFEQHIALIDEEANILKITKVSSNSKKDKRIESEFSIDDISWQNINVKVSGKRVCITISTKRLEKVIKTYEENEVENYQNKIEIEARDIKNAKDIINMFKRMDKGQQ